VVKRYPRYSETFIVTEVLAHEAAGLDVHIFTLFPSSDTHFQDSISRVRAPVHYLTPDSIKTADFWQKMQAATSAMPDGWAALETARGEEARDVLQALMLSSMIRQFGIEHLHAHFATSAANIARMASAFANVPYTITAHAKDIFHQSVNNDDLGRKIESSAATITVSDFNLRYLRETFPAQAAKVHRVYNGMDLSLLRFAPSSPQQPREPHVISVGRLVEKKGMDDLVRACGILAKSGERFRCTIVGEGDQEPLVRGLIDELGVSDKVQLLGPRPQREVFEMIQSAAVFAAPCVVGADGNRDGLPTVLLESMALGTACVSTDVTGIPEVIRHNETGLIVPQRNPAELATALKRMLREPPTRAKFAASARQLVEENFDITRNTAATREIFREAAMGASR
jgi:glycosyltransferase involved in cell wall biosynthesis